MSELKKFDELITLVQMKRKIKRVAVAGAGDEHTLEAVFKAVDEGILCPLLVGDESVIIDRLKRLGISHKDLKIFHTNTSQESAIKAVELVVSGEADFLMKGRLETRDLLSAVVDKDKGLRTDQVMTHLAILEIPNYGKLVGITDGGMIPYPNFKQKQQMVEHAVKVYRQMGYKEPKVAILTAIEKINPQMPETIDAGKLKELNQQGLIKDCIIEGPISYDLTMSEESAEIKGFISPITGNVDIMVTPDIHSGNLLCKSLIYSAGAKMAGLVIGASCPIVLTSRGASREEKYLSLVICSSLKAE